MKHSQQRRQKESQGHVDALRIANWRSDEVEMLTIGKAKEFTSPTCWMIPYVWSMNGLIAKLHQQRSGYVDFGGWIFMGGDKLAVEISLFQGDQGDRLTRQLKDKGRTRWSLSEFEASTLQKRHHLRCQAMVPIFCRSWDGQRWPMRSGPHHIWGYSGNPWETPVSPQFQESNLVMVIYGDLMVIYGDLMVIYGDLMVIYGDL